MMEKGLEALPAVLDRLGFKSMRPGQDKVIMNFLAGLDTLAVLPTATGKCLGLDEKVIMQEDGKRFAKPVTEIIPGDLVASPIGRQGYAGVHSITEGEGTLFEVTPGRPGIPPYVVNSHHVLSFMFSYKGKPSADFRWGDIVNMEVGEYNSLPPSVKERLHGWAMDPYLPCYIKTFPIQVKFLKKGPYRGFSLMPSTNDPENKYGNLFMLESGVVTHNSACFIIPTLCLEQHNLIVSPLVALMQDQVQSLWKKGISAGQLSGLQTDAENAGVLKRWVDGEVSILYTAPERMTTPLFRAAMEARRPDAIHVDEAHAVSIWGQNFRPHYKLVGDVIQELQPRTVGAFTATCRPETERDIRMVLGLKDADKVFHYPRRENLILSSEKIDNPLKFVRDLKKIKGSTIVYFSTIKRLEDTLYSLQNLLSEPITYYHGDLAADVKRSNQRMFMEDKIRIIFATSAFGMGIDKDAVRHVFNHDVPKSLDDLTQQDGRAGRDGNPSWCKSYLTDEGIRTQEFFHRCGNPSAEDVIGFYNQLEASADSQGVVTMSIGHAAKMAGISPFQLDSIMANLHADNVIRRSETKETTGTVKFLKMEPGNERLTQWYDAILEGGVSSGDEIEFDEDWLVNKLGYSGKATIRKWLKQWEYEGLLSYRPPRGRPPLEIIGGLDRVDFIRMHEMEKQSRKQMEAVRTYFDIPDEEKHSFLEEQFKTENQIC